jgi:hypothetical protein
MQRPITLTCHFCDGYSVAEPRPTKIQKQTSATPAVRQPHLDLPATRRFRKFEPDNFLHCRTQVADGADAPYGLRYARRGGRNTCARRVLSVFALFSLARTVRGVRAPPSHAITIGFSPARQLRVGIFTIATSFTS